MSSARRVASIADVPAGRPTAVDLAGTPIVLARIGDRVYACGGTCSHRGGPLGEGKISGSRLTCPWHGWMYDVRTGACLFPARGTSLPVYPVRVDDQQVLVELP